MPDESDQGLIEVAQVDGQLIDFDRPEVIGRRSAPHQVEFEEVGCRPPHPTLSYNERDQRRLRLGRVARCSIWDGR